MIVYLPSDGAVASPLHLMHVAPAADMEGEHPSEWMGEGGHAITIPVRFEYGRAEVPDNLGEYLTARGYAQRTALILPPRAGGWH